MSAKDLTVNALRSIHPKMKADNALHLLVEQHVNSLPVVDRGKFVCLMTDNILRNESQPESTVNQLKGLDICVRGEAHIFEVIDKMNQYDLQLIPVVDNENHYLGYITLQNALRRIATICDVASPGAVIRIAIPQKDFVLSDLARITEGNNARVVNLLTFPDFGSGEMEVVFKVDVEDVSPILQSLERFNYNVMAVYQRDSMNDETMQERLEELLYYIDM